MIISFLNQKGGVGKTTLSINVATCLALKKHRVLLIDADPQNSSLDWAATRKKETLFTVVSITKPIIHKEVAKLIKNYDYIIIDGPPRIYDVAKSAIVSSDVVIMPVQPSPYDIWAAQEVVGLIKEVAIPLENIKTIKSAFVINRKIVNTAIGRDVNDALSHYDVDVLETHICQRVSYVESATNGTSVAEATTKDTLAKQEIINLTEEIINKYDI
ncbi:MAG: AAA family ATPase [Rickettsiaceae bacterium]|nr:AAA family ATPase [Rickettsiaceae bacterium]